jgi:hypothetical protein
VCIGGGEGVGMGVGNTTLSQSHNTTGRLPNEKQAMRREIRNQQPVEAGSHPTSNGRARELISSKRAPPPYLEPNRLANEEAGSRNGRNKPDRELVRTLVGLLVGEGLPIW